MVLEKTLESPLDCKEIQPVHLKEISPEFSLEGLMFKLKFQSFGHLIRRGDSFEKTLMLGKIEGRRRRGQQRMRWLGGHHWLDGVWATSGSLWWTGKPDVLQSTGSQRVGHNWATELNWTGPVRPNWYLWDISPQNNEFHLFIKCLQNILQDRSHPGP